MGVDKFKQTIKKISILSFCCISGSKQLEDAVVILDSSQ
jgi:hypothetical protein